jgi:hypothetical protein
MRFLWTQLATLELSILDDTNAVPSSLGALLTDAMLCCCRARVDGYLNEILRGKGLGMSGSTEAVELDDWYAMRFCL